MSNILNKKLIAGDPGLTLSPLPASPIITLEEILPILQELAQYGEFENPEDVACLFCDMGDSGHSSCGKGFHDDQCISLMAKNILNKLGI